MSRGALSNSGGFRPHRDYGATTSTNSTTIPDVNFAGFSPTEFIGLSENIAQNIQKVKSSWLELEKSLKKIGTNRDNQEIRDKIQQLQVTTNQIITITSKDLHRLTAVVRRGGEKQQKLQVEKLTSDFKMVVEKYSSSQQQIAVKMKSIILRKASLQDDMNRDSMESNDFDKELVQKQIQARNLQFEQDMLIERENNVREIEANVLDVNQIMRELNSLINQQGEAVDTIENSIDHTTADVEQGATELMKAAQSQASYRRKVFYLLVIAVIVGLIVTGIIVSELKS